MYPYFRAGLFLFRGVISKKHENIFETRILITRVWLSDIDIYPELNNGRHLTLMDLGRYDLGLRTGLMKVLKEQNWGLMVAGNFTRYRHRILFLQSFQLHTQLVGYDDKWFYFYQQTIRKNRIHSAALVRTAVTSTEGLVASERVTKAMNMEYKPKVPDWVLKWIELNEVSPKLG